MSISHIPLDAVADEHGLIHADEFGTRGGNPRDLIELSRRRILTRVRRGSYAPTSLWLQADAAERHRLRLRATLRGVGPEFAAAGGSAAVVWGLPLLDSPGDSVTLLGPFRGGGRSDPGVHRITRAYSAAPIVDRDGFRVTDPVRTAADLAAEHGFIAGVMAFDAVLRMGLADRGQLERFEARSGFRAHRAVIARSIASATAMSESPGESAARAVIHLAGFAAPKLQHEFVIDAQRLRVDFYWPDAQVVVEFDGKVKYLDRELTGGDPGEVVWREKLREDLLRRVVRRVVRMTWADVRVPGGFISQLLAAGVPRS